MSFILKKNCSLVVNECKGYIKSDTYLLPISPRVAIFLALLNGKREIDEIKDILLAINLCKQETVSDFCQFVLGRYATLLENYIDGDENPNCKYNPQDFAAVIYPKDEQVCLTYPESILFIATNNCDKACIYCYMDARRKSLEPNALTYEEIAKILDDAAIMGVSHLSITGGEPFIRKDITMIIRHAHELGMTVNALTKFRLSDEQVKELANLNKFHLLLSHDIHINEIASHLVGVPNQAIIMEEVIKKLIDNQIQFTITPVVSSFTYNYFYDFLVYLQSIGVKRVEVARYLNSLGRNDDKLLITDEQWSNIIAIGQEFSGLKVTIRCSLETELGMQNDNDDGLHGTCMNGRTCLPITYDGKAILCEQVPNPLDFCFGDLRLNTIEEVWHSKEKKELLFPSKSLYEDTNCYHCNKFDDCQRKKSCIKRSLIDTGTAFSPSNYVKATCIFYKESQSND